jgi:hypothetical protein
MYILSDVYNRQTNLGTGQQTKVGMPVLYYRADLSGTQHDPNGPGVTAKAMIGNNNGFIYNSTDNEQLLALGIPPGGATRIQPLTSNFYDFITNPQIITAKRPYQPDSYILISAGWDGEYGTHDDVANFQQK